MIVEAIDKAAVCTASTYTITSALRAHFCDSTLYKNKFYYLFIIIIMREPMDYYNNNEMMYNNDHLSARWAIVRLRPNVGGSGETN